MSYQLPRASASISLAHIDVGGNKIFAVVAYLNEEETIKLIKQQQDPTQYYIDRIAEGFEVRDQRRGWKKR